MKKFLVSVFALLTGVCLSLGASYHLETADTGPALIIENTSTSTVTVAIGGTNPIFTVTVDGNANTFTANTDWTTITTLAADLASATNAAGTRKPLVVNQKTALAADSAIGAALLRTTGTLAGVGSKMEVQWDTSVVDHYDVWVDNAYKPVVIKSIYGNPAGTGDVTLAVYVDQSLAWQKVLTVERGWAVDATGTAYSATISDVVALPVDVGLPVGIGKEFFVRATRATDATSGNIGVVVE